MAALTFAWAAITIFVLKVISGPPKLDMAAVRALCISRSALAARLPEDAGWMMLWRPENIETTRNTEPEKRYTYVVDRNNLDNQRGNCRHTACYMGYCNQQ